MALERSRRHDLDTEPAAERLADDPRHANEASDLGAASRASAAQAGELHDAVQRKTEGGAAAEDAEGVHEAAQAGVDGAGQPLPHLDRIQASFGRHDVRGVRAHVGGAAREASETMGAEAYATGQDVAFAQQPDVRTAAHEAAHVVQQRAGVQLLGGVGAAGDDHERHADEVADLVASGQSAEAALDERAGAAPATDQTGQVQRKVTDATISAWQRNAANKTKEPDRKREFDHITRLLRRAQTVEMAPQTAHRAVTALMGDEAYAKYRPAMEAVLADLADQIGVSEVQVHSFVVKHLEEICPTGPGDRSDQRLLDLRIKIVVNAARDFTQDRLTVERLRNLDERGFVGDEWGKRGYCEVAAKALGSAEDIAPRTNGSTITWNHWAIAKGGTVLDPTWKQFFKPSDTAGKPPIFEGTAEDFRALGLPEDDTRQYMRLVSLGGTKLTPEAKPKVEPPQESRGPEVARQEAPKESVKESPQEAPKVPEDPKSSVAQAGKTLHGGLAAFIRKCGTDSSGARAFTSLDDLQQASLSAAAAQLQGSDPKAVELISALRDGLSALLQHGATQPMLELDDESRHAIDTHKHYVDKLSDLRGEGSDLKDKIDKNDLFKGMHQREQRALSKRYRRNVQKETQAQQHLSEAGAQFSERARALVREWPHFARTVASFRDVEAYFAEAGVALPDLAAELPNIGLGLIRNEDTYGFRRLHLMREEEIAEREYREYRESKETESTE